MENLVLKAPPLTLFSFAFWHIAPTNVDATLHLHQRRRRLMAFLHPAPPLVLAPLLIAIIRSNTRKQLRTHGYMVIRSRYPFQCCLPLHYQPMLDNCWSTFLDQIEGHFFFSFEGARWPSWRTQKKLNCKISFKMRCFLTEVPFIKLKGY